MERRLSLFLLLLALGACGRESEGESEQCDPSKENCSCRDVTCPPGGTCVLGACVEVGDYFYTGGFPTVYECDLDQIEGTYLLTRTEFPSATPCRAWEPELVEVAAGHPVPNPNCTVEPNYLCSATEEGQCFDEANPATLLYEYSLSAVPRDDDGKLLTGTATYTYFTDGEITCSATYEVTLERQDDVCSDSGSCGSAGTAGTAGAASRGGVGVASSGGVGGTGGGA